MEEFNTMSVRVPPEFRQRVREYLAKRNMSLRDYIMQLCTEDMDKNEGKEAGNNG